MPAMLPEPNRGQDDFAAGNPGQWDERDWAELSKIAKRTAYPKSVANQIEVDLIPDVWARLILFANALYDPEHTLHKDAKAAFRGILAVLGLRLRSRLQVTAGRLDFEAGRDWLFVSAVRRLDARNGAVMGGANQLFRDTGWDEVYFLQANGGPAIGATSPLTLVCPAEGAHILGLSSVHWFNGGRFLDPSVGEYLDSEERLLLAGWVERLRNELAAHSPDGKAVVSGDDTKLLRLLESYSADLRGAAKPAEGVVFSQDDRLPLGSSAYRYLAEAIAPEEHRLEESDILLAVSSAVNRKVLLPFRKDDPEVRLEPYPKSATELCVVRGRSLASLHFEAWGNDRRKLGSIVLPDGAEWIDPKSFFLARLTFLKGSQQSAKLKHAFGQKEMATEKKQYPLLPFTRELLDLMRGQEIHRHVKFWTHDNQVMVRLSLPIANKMLLVVEKAYPVSEQSVLEEMPVVEVWPPFRKSGWRAYYTFCWSDSATMFEAEPFPSDGKIEDGEQAASDESIKVLRLNSHPEGFFLRSRRLDSAGRPGSRPAGAILIDLPELKPTPRGAFVAGVDFGTSSTNVIVRSEGQEEKLSLRAGPLRAISSLDQHRTSSLFRYFLPPGPESEQSEPDEVAPFLSFLRLRDPKKTSELREIGEAHILFYSQSYHPQELGSGHIATNLKWDPHNKVNSQAYLKQLCLHVAAEAAMRGATSLHWRYSLPSAFNRSKRDDYETLWTTLQEFIARETGLAGGEAIQLTESTAAARYFKEKEKASPASGSIFVDVGGGTTDISIWQKNESRYQVSIQFAGRDLFLNPLFHLRQKFIPLFAQALPAEISPGAVNQLQKCQIPIRFFAHAEALLRNTGRNLPSKLHLLPGEPLELAAQIVRLGFGGLFYYLGQVLASLEKSGQYERKLSGVHVGGNGSQLLHWANHGQYTYKSAFAAVLVDCLLAGAKWTANGPAHIQVHLSARPKQEAAMGLVVDNSMEAENFRQDEVIAGEAFLEGGSENAATDRISRDSLPKIEVVKMAELENFLEVYRKASRNQGFKVSKDFLPESYIDSHVLPDVHQFLFDQQSQKEEDDVKLLPLFIKGLQRLLEGLPEDANLPPVTTVTGA